MSKPDTKTFNKAVARSHKIVELLAADFFSGATNKALAEAVGTSAVNMCRDLDTLQSLGYVEKMDNGNWRLTVRALRPLRRYQAHYEELQITMAETSRQMGL